MRVQSSRLVFLTRYRTKFREFLGEACKSLLDVISSHPERRKSSICLWLGQSLLYTVNPSPVLPHLMKVGKRSSRLALETGTRRFHGMLRVINTLCPYPGLV